jgi:hypothetical protein
MRRTLAAVIRPLVLVLLLWAPRAADGRPASPALAPAATGSVEIMLALDRSGSLAGTPLADLKTAARSFVETFADVQDAGAMGLVSFATSVRLNVALGTGFVAPLVTAITGLTATGATNAEDAIARTAGDGGFSDQSGVPAGQRAPQFLVFFSDGRPTALRGQFQRQGTLYDAVTCVTGNGIPGDGGTIYGDLGRPEQETWLGIDPSVTGDGIGTANCGSGARATTRWFMMDADPVPGYASDANCIPSAALHDYVVTRARALALSNAQALKDRGIVIYTIGVGASVDQAFLQELASGPGTTFYAPTSADLSAAFAAVAEQMRERTTPARRMTLGALKARYR